MKVLTIFISSLLLGLIYSATFWGTEGLRCAVSFRGCESEGDIRGLIFVLIGSIIIIGLAFGLFLAGIQRLLGLRAREWARWKSRAFLFCASMMYGVAIPAIFFALAGQFYGSFLREGGFWLNSLVGGACTAALIAALGFRKVTQGEIGER